MSKIYTAEGWVNWDYIYPETRAFCMMVGARGTGKTYGLFRYLLDHEVKFLYLRRLKSQLDECTNIDSNPFKKVNSDTGRNIQPFRGRGSVRFAPAIDSGEGHYIQGGEPVAIGVALSTFASIRGADFSDVEAIVFDEAVPMTGERTVKDEFTAFLNFYETVNRNRELEGKAPVKCFLLGNANKLGNPYFAGWGFMNTALKMIKGEQMMWRSQDGTRIMVMLLNSPISKAKGETALYKNGSDDFVSMAISNAFRTDATKIQSYKLTECIHVCSVGEVGIYKHKGTGGIYVSKNIQKQNYYEGFGFRLKLWQYDYFMLKVAYMNNSIVFESYEVELIFREYLNI